MAHERETNQRQEATETSEAHGDHAEQARTSGGFTSKGAIPPVLSGFRSAKPSASDRAFGGAPSGRDDDVDLREVGGDLDAKDDAERRRDQRFDNDAVLEEIAAGTRVIKSGDRGAGGT